MTRPHTNSGSHKRKSVGRTHFSVGARKSTSARVSRHLSREEGGAARERKSVHVSVMPQEVLAALDLKKSDVVVDATYGAGGHSALIKRTGVTKLITIDADSAAEADITGNFGDIAQLLADSGVSSVDKVLFDLGWRMNQLASGRGFSFLYDEPLVMSYADTPRSGFTAAEILNTWSEKGLADAFFGYGEERYARRIAKRIVERRAILPIQTTFELVELVRDAVPPAYRHGRIHPATKVFQALRMAVNDELGTLRDGITAAWKLLNPGGRLVVITFHSIEDREVKNLFKSFGLPGQGGTRVYKKPLVPAKTEVTHNPASRSAKLRVVEKTA